MGEGRAPGRRPRSWLAVGLSVMLPLGCSLLAPPDSDFIGGGKGGSSSSSAAAGGVGGGTAGNSSGGGTAGNSSGGTGGKSNGAVAGVGIDEAGQSAIGGASVGGEAGEASGGNAPGRPVAVGTPSGEWTAGAGLKTRFAAEVDPAKAHQDYPRPRLTRHVWASLNGLWDYAIEASGAKPPAFSDAKLLVPFPLESQLSGVPGALLNAGDFLWYHRKFTLPAAWRAERVLLHFGAVDWDASVRINGTEVVTHQGGYDGFSADITDQLASGDEQDIVVRVSDPSDAGTQPRGKQALLPNAGTSFTSVSGIWQSVWLEPVPALSIQNVDLDGDPKTGVVTLTPRLAGTAKATTLRAIVLDDGAEVARAEGHDGAAFELTVPSPKPWSPDSPFLYRVTFELEQDGVVVDSADSYLGLRRVGLGTAGGVTKVTLNDAPFVGVGVLSQGYWPEGLYTPPNDVALRADLTLVKTLGFNTVRVHQKLESERFYYWADQIGLLVWQDVPAGDNSTVAARTTFSAELTAMVAARHAHPSLAVWSLFTTDAGQKGAEVPKLVEAVKAITTSQLVIGVAGTGDDGSGDIRDRPDSGYVTSPVPDKRAVALGQYGSLTRAIQGHTYSGTGAVAQTAADTDRYVGLARRARGLAELPGLSTSIFRQLTDVENELDGLVTYDRAVTKIDARSVTQANTSATPPIVPLVQASEFEVKPEYLKDAQIFRYTTAAPASDFADPAFDDAAWTPAPAGIGDTGDAGARVRSKVSFNEIWTRTTFTLASKPAGHLIVRAMYDDETEVFVNGVLAVDLYGYASKYGDYIGSDAALRALVKGTNTIAVHTYNTNGGRYSDAGLWITSDAPPDRPADAPAATTPGLSYADYNLTLTSLPADLTAGQTPVASGISATIGAYAPALAVDNARALRLHGYVAVPEAGVYTFYVDTDDGARLKLGTQVVAESTRNDGTNVTKRSGNIALAAGQHEITIDYFANDDKGANVFNVSWSGPGIEPQSIPAAALSH